MNENIIIAILVVVIIAAGAALMFGQQNGKTDTQINFLNNETFQDGEQVVFGLNDSQGKALSGQKLDVTFNGNEKYSITTDQDGKCYLTISGKSAGEYEIEVNYAGDDKYNGCSAKEKITVTDDLADNVGTQTGTSVVVTTNQTNSSGGGNHTDPNNPFPGEPGTYFIDQYQIWVRSADQVVIDSYDGRGIGLGLNEWIALYGDNPSPVDTNTTG